MINEIKKDRIKENRIESASASKHGSVLNSNSSVTAICAIV